MAVCLQVEHSILEKEHVAEFIQQISEAIDSQQAACCGATEGQSVQPCSVAESEQSVDEVAYSNNSSSPPSTSDSQKELMPAVVCEVRIFNKSYLLIKVTCTLIF